MIKAIIMIMLVMPMLAACLVFIIACCWMGYLMITDLIPDLMNSYKAGEYLEILPWVVIAMLGFGLILSVIARVFGVFIDSSHFY